MLLCLSGNTDFNFEIIVDIHEEIDESNEENNRVNGICTGKMLSIEPSLGQFFLPMEAQAKAIGNLPVKR